MTPDTLKALADAGTVAIVLFIVAIVGRVGIGILRALWAEHLKADQDDRDQRDRALVLLEEAVAGNKLSAAATADLAKAWDERNKADVARARRSDRS